MSTTRSIMKEQAMMLSLIALITTIFIAQEIFGYSFYGPHMMVPQKVVTAWNAALTGNINYQESLPVLTCAFLHGSWEHLIFNMLYLWIFGALAVELIGSKWMITTFIITAITGSILHVAMNADSPIPTLGASGAVMGFEGLYLGMVTRWHLPDPHIWPMDRPIPPAQLAALGIIGLVMDYMGFLGGNLGVAYSAHLGGFIGGLILGAFVVPMPHVAQRR